MKILSNAAAVSVIAAIISAAAAVVTWAARYMFGHG